MTPSDFQELQDRRHRRALCERLRAAVLQGDGIANDKTIAPALREIYRRAATHLEDLPAEALDEGAFLRFVRRILIEVDRSKRAGM